MKKKIIIAVSVLAVIVGILLIVHYTPAWVSVNNLVVLIIGAVIGWFAKNIYAKVAPLVKLFGKKK